MFYEKCCSWKFCNFYIKVADLQLYSKETPNKDVFHWHDIFKNTYFEEHLLTAASDFLNSYVALVSSCFCIDPFIKPKPLSASFTKWSNTLKQFVGKLPTICLGVFDHFVGLALKGLSSDHLLTGYQQLSY